MKRRVSSAWSGRSITAGEPESSARLKYRCVMLFDEGTRTRPRARRPEVSASLALLRPRMMRNLDAPGVPSRTDLLIGREGVVTHDIEATVGAGRVNVGGEDWAARSAVPVVAGTRVRVVGADGIVLEVTPA